ncbi:methylation-associated defense system protein MAD4 [Fervidibacter sacchari]
MKDLVVLVADKDMEAGIRTLLEKRYDALGIRRVEADVFVHPEHDPGVFHKAHVFLRQYSNQYRYALVMFDHEGCGQENRPASQLESEVKERLEREAGWRGRCEVIVIEPELEVWVWSKSPHVAGALGLTAEEMEQILNRFERNRLGKPKFPKEAMNACLRQSKIPRSSSIYAELAGKVSLKSCSEPSFEKFRDTLKRWFPKSSTEEEKVSDGASETNS